MKTIPNITFQVLVCSSSIWIGCTKSSIAAISMERKASMKTADVIIFGINMTIMRYITPTQSPTNKAIQIAL